MSNLKINSQHSVTPPTQKSGSQNKKKTVDLKTVSASTKNNGYFGGLYSFTPSKPKPFPKKRAVVNGSKEIKKRDEYCTGIMSLISFRESGSRGLSKPKSNHEESDSLLPFKKSPKKELIGGPVRLEFERVFKEKMEQVDRELAAANKLLNS